ncbi:hypothetical protein COR50_16515 [Chitinophaga caeni]|uniref:Uncharacterized protein n=1 Tax=Chitinophaga caeni TaxID=2029983 RepID=A0A291QXD6_9BACT|nr:hypothetical protein [Chitinophaga caeni]ATL48636.1 hypothetical protein COR50_16515 [Chitinophaga caeni]
MDKSKIATILGGILVIISAFLPWLTIESIHTTITGLHSPGTSFGEPGKLNIALAIVMIILAFIKQNIPTKINLFVGGFLFAWTFRNFLMYSRCEMGECPHREIGLFLSIIAAAIAMAGILFTKTIPSKSEG